MYPAGESRIRVRYVTLPDGVTVRVLESIPDQRDAVLLVHGWGGSVYSFAETIPAIAAAGYRAIAFDLPGHGLSEKPDHPSHYTPEALGRAVMGVADAMGLGRFALVGHSLGGTIALELALQGERRIERLVLINPPALGTIRLLFLLKLFSPPLVKRFLPRLLSRRVVELVLRSAFGTRARPTHRDVEEYWAPTQFNEFGWACRDLLHAVNWERIPPSRLRSLRVPVLVVVGDRDRIVHGAVERAKQLPTAQVVRIADGGHLVMQECSVRTNAKLLLFLPGGRGKR